MTSTTISIMLGPRLCFLYGRECSCTSPPPPLPPSPEWPFSIQKRPSFLPPWIIVIICSIILAVLMIILVVYSRRMRQKKERQQQVGDQDCELRSKSGNTASTSNLVQRANGNACAPAADGPAK